MEGSNFIVLEEADCALLHLFFRAKHGDIN